MASFRFFELFLMIVLLGFTQAGRFKTEVLERVITFVQFLNELLFF